MVKVVFLGVHLARAEPIMRQAPPDWEVTVGNQQKWDTLGPERSRVRDRFGEFPECPVVKSSPIDSLGLHLPSAL